jgi:hypothetical protein
MSCALALGRDAGADAGADAGGSAHLPYRSVYLGALLGAAYGADAVPQDWRNKVTGWTEMEADVTALLP